MRRFTFAIVAIAAICLAVPAFAGHNEGCPPNNPNCNQTDPGGNGGAGGNAGAIAGALGIGIGQGGNAMALGGNVKDSGNSKVRVQNKVKNTVKNSNNINTKLQLKNVGNLKDSGNSSSTSHASVGPISNRLSNKQQQGQEQGQDQQQKQQMDQGQGQDQGQQLVDKSSFDMDLGDSTTIYEAPDFPVNTAAPVFAGNCAQGVSAQTMSFGGSFASGNPVCDFIAVAGAHIASARPDEAFRVLAKAEKAADWRFFFARVRMIITVGLL